MKGQKNHDMALNMTVEIDSQSQATAVIHWKYSHLNKKEKK